MDPISTIVAALAAGAAEAAKPTAVQAVKDAYEGFKALIVRKFLSSSTPLQGVEERPSSEVRQSALKEELVDAGADRDAEILNGLQDLIATLRQHAPQSVEHLITTVSGGINVQGGTFQGPVSISGGNASIQSGGGAVVQAAVNTGGGAFVGRDQVINNIALQSVDQMADLAEVLKASMVQLASNPESDALDAMAIVLDEISKLYQLIDTEFTQYLSLSFDDPDQKSYDRAVLLSLDGAQISARASMARGHCEKISRIYSKQLRPWFNARLPQDAIDRVEHAFCILSASDMDMSYAIRQLADWLSQKASQTLDLLDSDDITNARLMVKNARLDCQRMRQKLASTISTMRDIQAELLRLAP
ncbi:MAG: hypothetical protein E6Q59_05765 [Nitrosomonas sp.]|nr:MAG: hypothetical protein E6Q59_05765 [Nitrosomonas sp.]